MIEDKEMGIKVADNEDEAAWFNVTESITQEIKILKARNINAEKDLKRSAREIEQKFKNGARAVIKANKQQISIQKEILKLAESKLKL